MNSLRRSHGAERMLGLILVIGTAACGGGSEHTGYGPVDFAPVLPDLFGDGGALTDAWADIDGDGDPDRFVGFNGAPSRLYRNDRSGGFVDIAADVGLDVQRAVRTSAWGDFDADGDPDLMLGFAGAGPATAVYRNDRAVGFTNVAATLGLELAEGTTRQASWVDYDADGDLDLFLALRDRANRLFRNDGGLFTDVTESTGIGDTRRTVGAVWLDLDEDGDLDVVTANMNGDANGWWRYDAGRFTDHAPGTLLANGGRALADESQGSVRPCVVDADHDGRFDLYFANYGPNALLRRSTTDEWENIAVSAGLSADERSDTCTWGDFDHDGASDLYVNGTISGGVQYRDWLLRREGGDAFVDVTTPGVRALHASHGATWVDFDLDGDLDLAVTGAADDAMHFLLENRLPRESSRRSLQIRILDGAGKATRPGAEVRLYVAGTDRLLGARLLDTGSGYDAQSDLPVHFGLRNEGAVDVAVTVIGLGGRHTGVVQNLDPRQVTGSVVEIRIDDGGQVVR